MLPSPADLAYFVEVANTLNISRASERLGISQPSLSLAMRRIEDVLGTPVLVRSKSGVSLTQAGKQLLAHARRLQQTWEGIRAEALSSVNEVQGAYTLGCHPTVALYALSGFLPHLLAEHPKLNINLKHDLSRRIAEDVISMKVDVGIVVNPVRHPDLVIQKVCKDEFTLWEKAGGAGQSLTNGEAVLICDPELAQSQSLTEQFSKKGIKFGRIVSSGSLEVIADLVAHGCGFGFLPGHAAARARHKLRRVPKAPVFYDEHCLLFRVENKGVRSIQVINGAIKAFFEKL
jgi:DNA-binding transcriptional LysR family regulator